LAFGLYKQKNKAEQLLRFFYVPVSNRGTTKKRRNYFSERLSPSASLRDRDRLLAERSRSQHRDEQRKGRKEFILIDLGNLVAKLIAHSGFIENLYDSTESDPADLVQFALLGNYPV